MPPTTPGPRTPAHDRADSTRFPAAVDVALQEAGWQPGRWDIKQAEHWADALRAHASPAGHRHTVFPAAVEAWAEFGDLHITGPGPGRHISPTPFAINPLYGLHLARTLGDLGRALETDVAPSAARSSPPTAPPTARPPSPSTPKAGSTASTTPATGTWAPTSTLR